MCGIAGFIDHTLDRDAGREVVGAMLERIAHRGPDARGTYHDEAVWLGHNRLSIIDLSEAANQPFRYGDLMVIHNGEVYNYVELRTELESAGLRFRTTSDTEVIAAAYSHWGAECVNRFMGMWAFVIYDSKRRELFISRDRFGIKPFYYISDGRRFYFGSEYKALKGTPVFDSRLNEKQVARGLQLGWVGYGDETYYRCIRALPAASNLFLRVEDGRPEVRRYWDIKTGDQLDGTSEAHEERFRGLFETSVSMHLRSDVTVASCLSGGLDSSAIVSMAQQLEPGRPYKSFSVYYEGKGDVDERPYIREVINKYPSIVPHYISPGDDEVGEAFHHALHHADVPCTGSSFISQYFLMKGIAAEGIKVVLDGQGSDEYLGGYMHTYYRVVADRLSGFSPGAAWSLTRDVNNQLGAGPGKRALHFMKSILSLLNDEQSLYAMEYRNYYPFLCNLTRMKTPFMLSHVPGSRTDNFLYHLVFNTSLPSLLHYEDRNSMAFSVESRVPFLDHRLVEFVFQLATDEKVRGTVTKHILRKALRGILPEAVEKRKDKKGFVTPGENKWLRGPLSHLLDIDFSGLGILNRRKCEKLIRDYKAGDNSKAILAWRLAVFAYWCKMDGHANA